MAKLQILVEEVTDGMDAYDTVRAGRPIKEFIDELSTWYLRRSRERFKGDNEQDKQSALATLHEVLITLAKVMAPFMPFMAEKIYQELTTKSYKPASSARFTKASARRADGLKAINYKESVHLEDWPESGPIDQEVLTAMQFVRSFASMAHMQRAKQGINVRQPLMKLSIKHTGETLPYWGEVKEILADEINVKEVNLDTAMTQDDPPVRLDITVTPELKKEGLAREIIRAINQMRKESGLTIHDRVIVACDTSDEILAQVLAEFAEEIKKQVLATKIEAGGENEMEIDGRKIHLSIRKE